MRNNSLNQETGVGIPIGKTFGLKTEDVSFKSNLSQDFSIQNKTMELMFNE